MGGACPPGVRGRWPSLRRDVPWGITDAWCPEALDSHKPGLESGFALGSLVTLAVILTAQGPFPRQPGGSGDS